MAAVVPAYIPIDGQIGKEDIDKYVRFNVFTGVIMEITVCWNVTPVVW
jgi:hypothetical protein